MSTSPSVGFTPHSRVDAASGYSAAPQFEDRVFQPKVQEFNSLPLTVVSDQRIVAEQARARALGFSAGYAAGARAAAAELEAQITALEAQTKESDLARQSALDRSVGAFANAVAAAHAIQVPLLTSARDTVCSLAFELARTIVGVELPQDSAAVAGVSTGALAAVHRAVHAAPQSPTLTVKMAPGEAAQVLKHWDQIMAYLNTNAGALPSSVQVVADAAIAEGSAQAHYPNGYVDATLASAFDRAQEALANMLAHPNGADNS